MNIKELIEDLHDILVHDGNIEVRAANARNSAILGSTVARFSETGRMTLFLDLEGEE